MANFYPFVMQDPNQPVQDAPQTPSFTDKLNSFFSDGGGLLGNDPQAYARSQGLLGMAAQLLQASGPSTTPTSLGQALGRGLQGYQQGQQTAAKNIAALKQQKLASAGLVPSSVREWQYYNSLTPKQQKQYLGLKRAQQVLNMGNAFGVLNPVNPTQVTTVAPINLKPGEQPAVKGAQTAAQEIAKQGVANQNELNTAESSYPQIDQTVKQLKEIAPQATFTKTGQAVDAVARQVGMATPGGIAREQYTQTVRDVLFPQLRATFGAQFTVKEGEALVATLGDPNKTPEEKNAALDSFIQQKKMHIESLRRKAGVTQTPTAPKVRRYNPATGSFE